MRDNDFLADNLYDIWENHFSDVPRKNLVVIKFGRSSKRQLGSIKWANKRTKIKRLLKNKEVQEEYKVQDDNRITVITITRKFKDPSVPEYVLRDTIAHELCHYTHGFHSPLKQLYNNPHQGGIIRKELEARGLGSSHKKARKWIKENWKKYAK